MKYITIPRAAEVGDETLSFAEYLRLHVWPSDQWRKLDRNVVEAFVECTDKLAQARAGEIVGLSDEAYAVFAPISMLKGRELHPDSAVAMTRMMHAVVLATSEKPKSNGGGEDSASAAPA